MNLATFFSNIGELPYIPEVVHEVLAMLDDSDSNTDQIVTKLSLDPNLTAMILRLANSAHYSGARTISNLNDAIGTMGYEVIKSLILASGVATAFRYPVFFDQKQYWRDSMSIAMISKFLAGMSDIIEENDAFTIGALHNIGEILLAINEPNIYNEVKRILENESREVFEVEREILGLSSAEISAGLAKKWKFPDKTRIALYEQNNLNTSNELAALLGLAKYMHYKKTQENFIDDLPFLLLDVAGINREKFESELDDLRSLNTTDLYIMG